MGKGLHSLSGEHIQKATNMQNIKYHILQSYELHSFYLKVLKYHIPNLVNKSLRADLEIREIVLKYVENNYSNVSNF